MGSGFFGPLPLTFIILFIIISLGITAVFAAVIIMLIRKNSSNSSAPVITAKAKVIAKRINVRGFDRSFTDYFTTFEFEDGKRVELELKGEDYGLLVEGDIGELTYQGQLFRVFKREYFA